MTPATSIRFQFSRLYHVIVIVVLRLDPTHWSVLRSTAGSEPCHLRCLSRRRSFALNTGSQVHQRTDLDLSYSPIAVKMRVRIWMADIETRVSTLSSSVTYVAHDAPWRFRPDFFRALETCTTRAATYLLEGQISFRYVAYFVDILLSHCSNSDPRFLP